MFRAPLTRVFSRAVKSSFQPVKRNMGGDHGHAPKVRPAVRPNDFDGFMRWYLPEDWQVVIFVVCAWTGVVFGVKGINAAYKWATHKPTKALPANAHAAHTAHAPHAKKAATGSDEMPTDIDGFLAWLDQDAGNLDKALAQI